MRFVYLSSTGSGDPTRASLPIHLAVNGSVELGHETGVVLAGDGTELAVPEIADRVEGLGLPPLRELLEKVRSHSVPVYV